MLGRGRRTCATAATPRVSTITFASQAAGAKAVAVGEDAIVDAAASPGTSTAGRRAGGAAAMARCVGPGGTRTGRWRFCRAGRRSGAACANVSGITPRGPVSARFDMAGPSFDGAVSSSSSAGAFGARRRGPGIGITDPAETSRSGRHHEMHGRIVSRSGQCSSRRSSGRRWPSPRFGPAELTLMKGAGAWAFALEQCLAMIAR